MLTLNQRTTQTLTIRLPLPPTLPPSSVLSALHTYDPVFRAQDYVTSWTQTPVDISAVASDSFFREDGFRISSFNVSKAIPIISLPGGYGWNKELTFPAVCQSHSQGLRVRADAPAGVRVWAEYVVAPRRRISNTMVVTTVRITPNDSNDTDREEDNYHPGFELLEHVRVECNSLLMPFVARQMEGAHRELCQKVIDELVSARHA